MPGLPTGDAPSILNRSYTITADIEIPASDAEGMLVTRQRSNRSTARFR